MNERMKLLKINDIIVIICLLLVSVGLFLAFRTGDESFVAVVEKDGKELYRIDLLTIKKPYVITVDGDIPVKILVQYGSICFSDSVCRDRLCVNMGALSVKGQTAVCLPAKVNIYITGIGGLDGVTG